MKNLSLSRAQFNDILNAEKISYAARLLIETVADGFFGAKSSRAEIKERIISGVYDADRAGGKIAAIKWIRNFVQDNLEARAYYVERGGQFNDVNQLGLAYAKQEVESILGI